MLTAFDFNGECAIENFSLLLQDGIDNVLGAGFQKNSLMPKDILRSSGHYAPRSDKYTPVLIQLLLDVISDNFQT